ncbi:DNA methyltransferase [Clostridium zeae]|uniref:site-specific DNA-methyltransferase (adenine-specific) n=1 Tax=Clostridium zeae TaxID=2759022 RepID=A0ABQ1ECI0_9CLOT|nr:N-6 DNA methylase [Clostridium zeae]GFZ32439.1 DNA methyltransferase [Clostridium zeae]
MSFIFDNKKNKKKCQIFTPQSMVDTMLDLAGYTTNLLGRRVLENSFGTGNILKAIVIRYIDSCLNDNIPFEIISENLGKDIYGIELDNELFYKCKEELNAIVAYYKLPPVEWSLYNDNALTWETDLSFDLIIGNPPYITYKEIDEDSKKQIKESFVTCSVGKFDYCYAFIEAGIQLLSTSGKLVQLVPSNIYKNVFANKLRHALKEHISTILDYPSQQIFQGVLTSTSIFLYDRTNQKEYICYRNETEQTELLIQRKQLNGKWMFSNSIIRDTNTIRFGDVFNASIVIATLLNEAFIVTKDKISEKAIEKSILRKAVSPRSLRYNREEYIIFPYKYDDNTLVHINSNTFKDDFPGAAKHLEEYIVKLDKRKKDKNVQWFEYGRTQALAHLNQRKLLISTVVTNKVDIYELDRDTIPYSGIYITEKSGSSFTLKNARFILESPEFMEYVKKVGISVSGQSLRITCKDINNFEFKGGS